jgi:hypothetical protein
MLAELRDQGAIGAGMNQSAISPAYRARLPPTW